MTLIIVLLLVFEAAAAVWLIVKLLELQKSALAIQSSVDRIADLFQQVAEDDLLPSLQGGENIIQRVGEIQNASNGIQKSLDQLENQPDANDPSAAIARNVDRFFAIAEHFAGLNDRPILDSEGEAPEVHSVGRVSK
jgi:hypothetical protein